MAASSAAGAAAGSADAAAVIAATARAIVTIAVRDLRTIGASARTGPGGGKGSINAWSAAAGNPVAFRTSFRRGGSSKHEIGGLQDAQLSSMAWSSRVHA